MGGDGGGVIMLSAVDIKYVKLALGMGNFTYRHLP